MVEGNDKLGNKNENKNKPRVSSVCSLYLGASLRGGINYMCIGEK